MEEQSIYISNIHFNDPNSNNDIKSKNIKGDLAKTLQDTKSNFLPTFPLFFSAKNDLSLSFSYTKLLYSAEKPDLYPPIDR